MDTEDFFEPMPSPPRPALSLREKAKEILTRGRRAFVIPQSRKFSHAAMVTLPGGAPGKGVGIKGLTV